jgi:hypothetical protein
MKAGSVSGTVTLDGKPVGDVTVSFISPNSGVPVTVAVNPDGTYRADNVPVGNVQVVVMPNPDVPSGEVIKNRGKQGQMGVPPPLKVKIPGKYAEASTSGLAVDVGGAETQYDVKLETEKPAGR